jgi:hypothetical protein
MGYPTRWLIALSAFTTLLGTLAQGGDKAQWVNLQSLHPDQKVTLTQTNGHKTKGRFRGFSESAVTLQTQNGQISVQRAEVQSVIIGSGLIRLRNSAIGMGIGAGVGALIATKTPARDQSLSALGAALFSFGVGGVCGAVVPGRKTIYEARSMTAGKAKHDTLH